MIRKSTWNKLQLSDSPIMTSSALRSYELLKIIETLEVQKKNNLLYGVFSIQSHYWKDLITSWALYILS